MPDAIVEAVSKAAQTGEILRVTSSVGSTPGQPVVLRVLSVCRGGYAFEVSKLPNGEIKRYDVNYVDQIIDSNGRTYHNDGVAHVSAEVKARRERRDELIQKLSSIHLAGEPGRSDFRLVREMHGRVGARPLRLFRIHGNARDAVLHAKNASWLHRVGEMLSSHELTFWDICAGLLHGEFWWPAWMRMQADAAKAAGEARDGVGPYRLKRNGLTGMRGRSSITPHAETSGQITASRKVNCTSLRQTACRWCACSASLPG